VLSSINPVASAPVLTLFLKGKKGRGLPLSGTSPAVSADKLACY